jgi:hypothetical protein
MTSPLRHAGAGRRSGLARGLLSVAALCCLVSVAQAKPARCFTTDDGEFGCEFRATGRDGSFEISAPGKPTYILNMDEPNVASGFVNFGSRNVSLPGRYLRDPGEPGCWVNDSTGTKLCAW